jgi:hypothetical protein
MNNDETESMNDNDRNVSKVFEMSAKVKSNATTTIDSDEL